MIFLISLIATLAFLALLLTFYSYSVFKKQKIIRKMERQLVAPKEGKFSIMELLGYKEFISEFQNTLINAGIKADAENFLFTAILINVIIIALSIFVSAGYGELIAVLVLDIAVFYGLGMVAESKKKKRVLQFADTAQDIADYLKVNNNLLNAIEKIAPDLEKPLRTDFEKIIQKVHSGIALTQALKEFSKEADSPIIESWVDSIIFSGQMKADISETSEMISNKIKQRIRQNKKIQALMMQTKSTVYAMIIVMSLIMVGMFLNNPDYMKVLKTTIGKIAVTYTVISYALTTFYIFRKINKMIGSI